MKKVIVIASAVIAILLAIFVIVMTSVEMLTRKFYSNISSMTTGYFIEFIICHIIVQRQRI